MSKTWMAGTSPDMTDKNAKHFVRTSKHHAAAPDLHGHARFRGADAAGPGGPWPRDRGGLYPRGKTRRARHEAAGDAGRAGGAAARDSRADATDAEDAGSPPGISRAQCRCGCRRHLWHDPAENH